MKLNDAGYKLMIGFEGIRLLPYLDSVKIPTIGMGNTYYPDGRKVTMKDPKITKDYALLMFKLTADKFAERVSKRLTKPVNQNQFNALVSFAYNIGIGAFENSTLLKRVNINPNDFTISAQFMKWNKAGGKVIAGLTNRRKEEARIYFS